MPQQNAVLAALKFYGEKPIAGPQANQAILDMLAATTYPKGTSDEVPWCSAFLVYIFKECGIHTDANAAAISWLNYGMPVDQPELGDVVVLGFPAGSIKYHHVGMFIRENEHGIFILAGNQDGTVDIDLWKKEDVMAIRRA